MSQQPEKHTPGPWRVESGDCIVAADGSHVVCFGHDYEEYGCIGNDADKPLIAASTDLLAACRALVESLNGDLSDEQCEAWDACRAAIAKAEGVAHVTA